MTHLRKVTSQLKHSKFKSKRAKRARKTLLKEIEKEEAKEK